MNLPTPIIPFHSSMATVTGIEHARLLAAEHMFKSNPGFWTWLAHDDLEWYRNEHAGKIHLRSISERYFSESPTCYPNDFELSYIERCRGQLNFMIRLSPTTTGYNPYV